MKRIVRYLSMAMVLILLISLFAVPISAKSRNLKGSGQRLDPYRISSVEDLKTFRNMVDAGNSFEDQYVLQTCDLDLASIDGFWNPIGDKNTKSYFFGVYNGGGHVIKNLNVKGGDSGFFNGLGGSVMNLGIESGHLSGGCMGSIASHAVETSAMVINCYNKASIEGYRVGGIVDNFSGGIVVDCWNIGELQAKGSAGGIVGYNALGVLSSSSYGAPAFSDRFSGASELIVEGDISDAKISELEALFKEKSQPYSSDIAQIIASSQEGEGTAEDPYRIRTLDDLIKFRMLVNIGCTFSGNWVRQETDIDLSSVENWEPIAHVGAKTYFHGVYDGAGHTISNLNIKGGEEEAVGFFGGFSGILMNLGIESGRVEGDEVGGLVASAGGTVPMIINCYNKAEVIGISSAAGIANEFRGGLIVNCLNLGKVSAQSGVIGGICADNANRIISSFSVGVPLVNDGFKGIVEDSCKTLNSTSKAIELLNESLYEAATRTNYQRNNLFKWTEEGSFGARQNYFAKFIVREIVIAIAFFAVLFAMIFIWKTAKRENSLSLAGMRRTISGEKLYLAGSIDARIRTIVNLIFIFAVGMLVVGYINRDNTITYALGYWLDSNDVFMDYLNPLNTVMNNNYDQVGHYTDVRGTYPPIARAIFWITGQVLPVKKQLITASAMRLTYGSMLVLFVFAISFLILYIVYKKLYKDLPNFMTILLILSAPMFFLVDRGNILIFTYVASVLFIAGYRSKNPVTRHLSYICLAIAAATKIYPVVLGLLVLREKKWKDTLWCVIYGAAFCILPFFFIGGIPELLLYIRNITTSIGKNAVNFLGWILNYSNVLAGWSEELLGTAAIGRSFASSTIYIVTALLAACALFAKERWKAVLAVCLIIILFPGYTVAYCGVFYTVPLLLLLADSHSNKRDYVYAILLAFGLAPMQFVCGAIGVTFVDYWRIVGSIGVILAFMLIVDCAVCTIKSISAKKRERLSCEVA